MSGHYTNMKFLPGVMKEVDSGEQPNSDDNLNMSSPLIQSIIVATMCGRTLEHKLQPGDINQVQHNANPDLLHYTNHEQGAADAMNSFRRRHQSLIVMLTGYNNMLLARVSSTSEHPDPMLLFVALAAHMAVLMLCEAMETEPRPLCGIEAETMQQVTMLGNKLGQLNYFQTHPFTPIPLLVSAKFCMAHRQKHPQCDSCNQLEKGIASALERLAHINGLAENFSYNWPR